MLFVNIVTQLFSVLTMMFAAVLLLYKHHGLAQHGDGR